MIEVELIEAGRNWLQEHHPQGTRARDVLKSFERLGWIKRKKTRWILIVHLCLFLSLLTVSTEITKAKIIQNEMTLQQGVYIDIDTVAVSDKWTPQADLKRDCWIPSELWLDRAPVDSIVPLNGAEIAALGIVDFNQVIDCSNYSFTGKTIRISSGNQLLLEDGSVLLIKTNTGNYAKMRIDYHRLWLYDDPCGKGIDVTIFYQDDGSHFVGEVKNPIADFIFSPKDPHARQTVIFDASKCNDPDGNVETYNWYFGDGKSTNGKIVKHSYLEGGEYVVTLTITDNHGLPDSREMTIPVQQSEKPVWENPVILAALIGAIATIVVTILSRSKKT